MMHLTLLHVSILGVVFIVDIVFIVEAMLIFWFVFILRGGSNGVTILRLVGDHPLVGRDGR